MLKRRLPLLAVLALTVPLLLAVACVRGASAPVTDVDERPSPYPVLETGPPPTADEAATWSRRQSLHADLDRDGTVEAVVLAAEVETRADGTPLWEDGHRWALVVDPDGEDAEILYWAFLPNGRAEAALLDESVEDLDRDPRRMLLVVERTPKTFRSIVVAWSRKDGADTVSKRYQPVDGWFPTVP